ncbi:MAG: tryptophan--tRNA ligase, partial [Candidatus Parcubacteria bacterium]|nr:tryptophan--tRNA ligase [Candidatus Parcubacteria bacterium]
MNRKPIILSGIQPSGELHVGNYLGAMKNHIELQNSGKYDCYFFVADLHALTEGPKAADLLVRTRNLVADYLAAGLDPKKSTIFVQSLIPEHTELAWIFNTLLPIAELERMTQYKDKSARQKANINAGLFDYPVLQAADILLYHGSLVPVGQDQVQHVELTRLAARKFNQKYGDYFAEPKPLLTNVPKVMSLLEPEKKMSKSLGQNHYIGINDEPEVIKKKLSRAVSDNGKGDSDGGRNLLMLLENFSHPDTVKYFFAQKEQGKIKFGELKAQLADDIATYFKPFREQRRKLEKDQKYLDK